MYPTLEIYQNTGALGEYLLPALMTGIHAGYILSNQHPAASASLAINIWKVGRTKHGIWITVFFTRCAIVLANKALKPHKEL